MKVIVCGAGQVGSNIARHLAEEQNDVTIIDQSPELIRRISEAYDVRGLVGFASHPDMLDRAGAADAEMLIAVTFADEVNMVACQVAHSIFNVPTKIARIRAQNYLRPSFSHLFTREHMPIDAIISPEVEVAHAVNRALHMPGAFDMLPFADDRVRMIGVRIEDDCPIAHQPLRQLTELFPNLNIIVTGINRGEKLFVPSPTDQMLPGDDVYFVVDTQHARRAMPLFGHEEHDAHRIVIVGGGNIGLVLGRDLEQEKDRVNLKVIESDRSRAEFVADRLESAVVLCGDALDAELLEEANISNAHAIVALTNDDETNILVSLMAKQLGCEKAIALVNNKAYEALVGSLGIDVAVNPRATTVSSILQHVRRGRIRRIYSIRDGAAEVMEAEALETSLLIGKPLREVELPAGVIVGAIVRGPQVLKPRGSMVIQRKDRVILFALRESVKKLESMLSAGLRFF
ncbi:Trk system potassium transporter TrkA [Minwuia thermotolerans]|uniref:Trk system potassium uptake protein TrkA n=1 Tax=Minwuia thermotolerans TaxID=2056226 RepID=A0A2M9FYW3_9PROT|nr:Trk system potassium transporter TrkA [Minwuia thermotolerans]PJK28653.1 Trk system potassium transporter TrkA [Minwuia thermotolerans]